MKIKFRVCFFLFINGIVWSKQTVIVLYGCSSTGKTSIAQELFKSFSGSYRYIPSNQYKTINGVRGNVLLWRAINQTLKQGTQVVIIDTHSYDFLLDPSLDVNFISVLLYCSPRVLVEHVSKRNLNDNPMAHRNLKSVSNEFCDKFKPVSENEKYIDIIRKKELKSYGLMIFFLLRKINKRFFASSDQAYIAPYFNSYDCFINTGKLSITQSAKKIKDRIIEMYGDI